MAVTEINDLSIEKGTDFEKVFYVFNDANEPLMFALDSVGSATISKYPTSPVSHSFVVGITTGAITIGMAKTITTELEPGRNYFNVLVESDGTTIKFAKGTIIVNSTIGS
jgi:hypothetical protein